MKHGTICKIGNILFDYKGRTRQGYPRGGHSVIFYPYYSRLAWISGSPKGNVMSYITTKFELATPEEIEIFYDTLKNAINK